MSRHDGISQEVSIKSSNMIKDSCNPKPYPSDGSSVQTESNVQYSLTRTPKVKLFYSRAVQKAQKITQNQPEPDQIDTSFYLEHDAQEALRILEPNFYTPDMPTREHRVQDDIVNLETVETGLFVLTESALQTTPNYIKQAEESLEGCILNSTAKMTQLDDPIFIDPVPLIVDSETASPSQTSPSLAQRVSFNKGRDFEQFKSMDQDSNPNNLIRQSEDIDQYRLEERAGLIDSLPSV